MASIPSPIRKWVERYITGEGSEEIASQSPVQSVNTQTGDVTISVPVDQVNGQTGDVTLTASDVNALADTYSAPVQSVNGGTGNVTISVPVDQVNGQTGDVTLTASDVNALADTYSAPVQSVNSQTGDVTISTGGGAIPSTQTVTSYSGLPTADLSEAEIWFVTGEDDIVASTQLSPVKWRSLSDFTTVASAILDSGVARYKFEQDVTDSWASLDATDNTGVGYTTSSAVGSYAKLFDGSGNINLPSLPVAMDGSEDFSVSLWFYSTSNSDQTFFRFGDDAALFRTNDDGSGNYTAYWQVGGAPQASGTTHLTDGTFYMVTFTYSSSNDTGTIYVNDSSEDNGSNTGWTSDGSILIGDRTDGLFSLDGRGDDSRIYDKELTSTEVSNLFNNGSIQ